MLSLKDLLSIAASQLKELTTLPAPDFRLEQAEFDKENNEWKIVVSFLVEKTNPRINILGLPSSEFKYHRIYKSLHINSKKEITGLYIYNKNDFN